MKQSTQGEPVWTTAQGQKIPYRSLSFEHLENILKDGYRNPYLVEEAKRRGTLVPVRLIDRLSPVELIKESFMFLESCASCAIEGNTYGDKVCKAWDNNKALFYHYLNEMLEHVEEEKKALGHIRDIIEEEEVDSGI